MLIAAHQPEFLPWPGFFNKMALADVFVILDDVQFTKSNWQNRNLIYSKDKGKAFLTAPVDNASLRSGRLSEVRLSFHDRGRWQEKNWRIFQSNYSRHPYFGDYSQELNDLMMLRWELLLEQNLAFIDFFRRELQIRTPIVMSSSLGLHSTQTQRLIEIVQSLEGKTYLSGKGASAYLDEVAFQDAGLEVTFQKFSPKPYAGNPAGIPLSTVDALMNLGSFQSSELVKELEVGE